MGIQYDVPYHLQRNYIRKISIPLASEPLWQVSLVCVHQYMLPNALFLHLMCWKY